MNFFLIFTSATVNVSQISSIFQNDGILKKHSKKKLFIKALKEMIYVLPDEIASRFDQFFDEKSSISTNVVSKSCEIQVSKKRGRENKIASFQMTLRSTLSKKKEIIPLKMVLRSASKC